MEVEVLNIAGMGNIELSDPGQSPQRIAVLVPGLSATTGLVRDDLQALAERGSLALSLNPVGHGDRGSESREEILTRVFGAFRAEMWPIIGLTALDVMRVIDWALTTVGARIPVVIGGVSMGGDIAVAVAGAHPAVSRAAGIASSPDWTRPGMRLLDGPEELDQGQSTTVGEWLRSRLEPISHVGAYRAGSNVAAVAQ